MHIVKARREAAAAAREQAKATMAQREPMHQRERAGVAKIYSDTVSSVASSLATSLVREGVNAFYSQQLPGVGAEPDTTPTVSSFTLTDASLSSADQRQRDVQVTAHTPDSSNSLTLNYNLELHLLPLRMPTLCDMPILQMEHGMVFLNLSPPPLMMMGLLNIACF